MPNLPKSPKPAKAVSSKPAKVKPAKVSKSAPEAVEAPKPSKAKTRVAGAVPVFWGGDDSVVLTHDSVVHVLNPGENFVEGTFKHEPESTTPENLPAERKLVKKLSSEEVAKGLVALHGHLGVCALTGDDAVDEQLKAEARAAYLRSVNVTR